jgi:hypothetical protein
VAGKQFLGAFSVQYIDFVAFQCKKNIKSRQVTRSRGDITDA